MFEIRGDRFRYRQYCDPEPNVPFVPEPVEGAIKFDGNIATLSGPGEWRILRRMVHVNGIDMLLRVDAYDTLMRNDANARLRSSCRRRLI